MSLESLLGLGHLFGLALGLGGAFCAEIVALRMLGAPVKADDVATLRRLARAVAFGYALLVLSGLGFLWLYAGAAPEKLANPKLWAKLTIVGVLGLNGLALHRVVLPGIAGQVGRRLLEGRGRGERLLIALVGSASTVSWLAATLMGAVRELNFAAPYGTFIAAYGIALGTAFGLALGAIAAGERRASGSALPGASGAV